MLGGTVSTIVIAWEQLALLPSRSTATQVRVMTF